MAKSFSHSHQRPPTIALPPRSSSFAEALISAAAGFSPGPMTLLSSLFSPDASATDLPTPSFSHLLAGAMASTSPSLPNSFLENEDSKFKMNRPVGLVVSGSESSLFTFPPCLSPSGFLNSPGLFSPALSPFGMSHQQALAQVTAQAALSNTPETYKHLSVLEPDAASIGPHDVSQSGAKSQGIVLVPDKPVDDGYNWRKYGQKQVKGSCFPRSYYKCTYFRCPVKKKVEQSPEGQVIEIIYKGQHNHEKSPPKKLANDGNASNGNTRSQEIPEVNQVNLQSIEAASEQIHGKDHDLQAIEVKKQEGDPETNNGPIQKRRKTGSTVAETTLPINTVVEPKIIVQTRSEVDLLDDGFRWRKYGQKVVKGNSHPRSYYKCTTQGCNVRKHVERASTDPKAVVTTYEGKHNHDIPVGRGNSYNSSSAPPSFKIADGGG